MRKKERKPPSPRGVMVERENKSLSLSLFDFLFYYTFNIAFTRAISHGPKFEVPSHLTSIRAISTVESMEVWTHHSTQGPDSQVLSPTKYDMDTYMATLFGGEAWDLC